MGTSECQIKVAILVKHLSAENKNTSSKNKGVSRLPRTLLYLLENVSLKVKLCRSVY